MIFLKCEKIKVGEERAITCLMFPTNVFAADEENAVSAYKAFLEDRHAKYGGGEYSGGGLIKSIGGLGNVLALMKNGLKEMSDERILGSGDFVEVILKEAGELQEVKVPAEEIMKDVCGLTAVSEREIISGGQSRIVVKARALYCCLAKEKCKIRVVDLAKDLGLTCGAICRLIERGKALQQSYVAVE